MKKLLLSLTSLFGLLCMSHLSFAAGCGAQVCTCPGGGYVTTGQYCPEVTPRHGNYHAYIAVNPQTGKWASADTYPSKSDAKKYVLSKCGNDCEYKHDFNRSCISAAYSAEDQILAFGSKRVGLLFDNDKNSERRQKAADDAMKKCVEKGGTDCKLLTAVCGYNHDK